MPHLLKRILLFLLSCMLVGGFLLGRHLYVHFQNKKAHEAFLSNLSDTASPTVYKDSIWIDYQEKYRTLHIYVPPDYEQDISKRYPVLYFMDGESCFNDMENEAPEWQIDEIIDSAYAKGRPTAIVIGIKEAEDRDAEYTPFVNENNPHAHGDQYATWVATELKPWVDATFRSLPEPQNTTIGGISRSGMMAYYILMTHPDVFGNAVIQSPSMWVNRDRLLAMDLESSQLRNKKIFVSVGGKEGRIMIPNARDVYGKFKAMGLDKDQLRFEKIPGEGHWHLTWRKSFALAYPWVMNN